MGSRAFPGIDPFRLCRRMVEQARRKQRIVHHYVSRLQRPQTRERKEVGIARARADERHESGCCIHHC